MRRRARRTLVPCESSKTFADCHGADVPIESASPGLEAQWRRPTTASPCEHDKVYANHVLTSIPPRHPWVCRKCKARGDDCGVPLGAPGEYERVCAEPMIRIGGDNHAQIALGDIRNGGE